MAVYASAKEKFDPCPMGPQQAVCCDVIDHGLLTVRYNASDVKQQHKITIRWQSDKLMANGLPYLVQRRFTLTLSAGSTLRDFLESWRGRPFSEADLEPPGFDVERLIGVNCLINVMHNKRKNNTYADVATIMPITSKTEKLTVRDYVRVADRTAEDNTPSQDHDDDPPF